MESSQPQRFAGTLSVGATEAGTSAGASTAPRPAPKRFVRQQVRGVIFRDDCSCRPPVPAGNQQPARHFVVGCPAAATSPCQLSETSYFFVRLENSVRGYRAALDAPLHPPSATKRSQVHNMDILTLAVSSSSHQMQACQMTSWLACVSHTAPRTLLYDTHPLHHAAVHAQHCARSGTVSLTVALHNKVTNACCPRQIPDHILNNVHLKEALKVLPANYNFEVRVRLTRLARRRLRHLHADARDRYLLGIHLGVMI